MENIDNIGKKSLEALSRDNLNERSKKKLAVEIVCALISLSCLGVGLLYTYVYKGAYTIVPQLLYFLGFLIEGVPVMITAIKGIFSRDLKNAMEILVAIAIIACVFNQDLILALLIPLILNAVHLLEERSIMGGRDVIDGLKKMQQTTAILLAADGTESVIDARELKLGQRIVIKPGSGIAIDGVVVSGESHVDQKSLTGEPQPFFVSKGEQVYAGTVNLDGRIVVEVTKEYVDTSFSKILRLLEESEGISIPETRIIDRFMAYYIPFALAIAAGAALVSADVSKAIAILVVSCPCGQMLVSSAPMIASLSVATKRGVLIKNSKFIEELTEIDTVVFDKTGTVTVGELALVSACPVDGIGEREMLEAAASVASASTHPVSRAVIAACQKDEKLKYRTDMSVREISGGGMEGESGELTVRFGNRDWLSSLGYKIPAEMGKGEAGSVSFVTRNAQLLGYLCFGDTPRENAAKSIAELKEIGVERTVMLTGDREEAAKSVCETVGIDELHAKLLPQDKLAHMQKLGGDEHRVLAVGDGINDALALREASVGIAMGAMGSDLAIQSADIALMNNNLMNIPFAIKLAKQTRKIIYQNIALSMSISLVMIALSAFGVISALAGSVLHNAGAFAVLINSSRILKSQELNS